MEVMQISAPALNDLINSLIGGKQEVIGVVRKGGKYVFDKLERAEQFCPDYDETILPPKKYFLPMKETLLTFTPYNPASYNPVYNETPRMIWGIHPADLAAIALLDKVHADGYADGHYLARRSQTTLVGIYPTKPYKYRFTKSMIENEAYRAADLMLIDLGNNGYAVEVITNWGKEILRKSKAIPADAAAMSIIEKRKQLIDDEISLSVHHRELPLFLEGREKDSVFEKRSKKCFSCGSCVLVCPTCFCFDVKDEVDLSLKEGERTRHWDGCMLQGFATVAGGHDFRKNPMDRLRHRIFRKTKYLQERYGMAGCVGCGRCAHACTANIASPAEIINEIVKNSEQVEDSVADHRSVKIEESPFLPKVAALIKTEPMTNRDRYFEFKIDGKEFNYKPGQFAEISIPGIGEAPFSISSSPTRKGSFEMVIRDTGKLTSFLHKLKAGETAGLRGPFGTNFPMDDFKGKNLLFVAGGIGLVPLRSAINYALDHRERYGNIIILFGCTDPGQRLFTGELSQWAGRKDIHFMETVDKSDGKWKGNVGVITTLFPKVKNLINSSNTKALIVGPPIMYKFVITELKNMGFIDKDIIVSLERKMKCGVGKCGHCQINSVYVCKEGPVFSYESIKNLKEAI